LYRAEFSPGIYVATFVLGGATNWYRCEAFVLGGLNKAPTSLCERTFVPVGDPNGTNVIICTGGKIPGTNEKLGLRYMCDSLEVLGQF
jgi:hypothetical protein